MISLNYSELKFILPYFFVKIKMYNKKGIEEILYSTEQI